MDRPTVFPDLSQQHAAAFSEQPVKLNGQKVLFDKKVTLMPVALEKQRPTNGQTAADR